MASDYGPTTISAAVYRSLVADQAELVALRAEVSALRAALEAAEADRDAALARAVPDGHTRINGRVWRLEAADDINRYRLVPADTEP